MANAFAGFDSPPSPEDLKAALNRKLNLWLDLVSSLETACGLRGGWYSYSRKAGWSFRMKHGERNIVYLSIAEGAIQASFALGEKAIADAKRRGVPPEIAALLDQARRYAEGAAVRLEISRKSGFKDLHTLVAAKLAH